MYMPAQIQLKMVKMVEIEPESDVHVVPRLCPTKHAPVSACPSPCSTCLIVAVVSSIEAGAFPPAMCIVT